MSLILKREDIKAHGIKYVLSQQPAKKPEAPVLDPKLAKAIELVAAAVHSGRVEQNQLAQKLATFFAESGKKTDWKGIRITKRDANGAIKEVEFIK